MWLVASPAYTLGGNVYLGTENINKILTDIGVTEKEAEVYIFLAKHGVIRSGEIVKGMRMHRADVYRFLKSLQVKGFVETTLESPARFAIVPFEKVLDSFIKAKHDEAVSIERAKQDLLEDWKSLSKPVSSVEPTPEKFIVIEGSSKILAKMRQMISETERQFSMITSSTGLVRADQSGVFDSVRNNFSDSGIEYRFLIDFSSHSLGVLKAIMKRTANRGFRFRARHPAFKPQVAPNMVVRDGVEILFFITPTSNGESSVQEEVCMLTNCKALVQSFSSVFEDMWRNSIVMESKIAEIERRSLESKISTVESPVAARNKREQILSDAKKEILMVTSSEGLLDLLGDSERVAGWIERKVSVKIMAPIMGENLNASLNLPECCEVRHFPNGHYRIMVVDGQKLFQFADSFAAQTDPLSRRQSEFASYSEDTTIVEKMHSMLEGIWKRAHVPTVTTLESILAGGANSFAFVSKKEYLDIGRFEGVSRVKEEGPFKLTETDVVQKILSGKKYPLRNYSKHGIVNYGSMARAVVHLPARLNLPDMLIWVTHLEKQSSFGQEDCVSVYLQSDTENRTYEVAAIVTDSPFAAKARATVFPKSLGVPNIQVARKDELQVRVQGNTLFAGWTMPVQLHSAKHVLPPCCILFEGYGEIRTYLNRVRTPEGQIQTFEINDYEAFVTFFHPKSKYMGPGTDGEFARDAVVTTLPPV